MTLASLIKAILRDGALLVFPIQNRKLPASLWSVSFPRSEMKWEWDDDGDNRVAKLWHLKTEISLSRKAIYTKWYQGRATVFSPDVFKAMVAAMGSAHLRTSSLSSELSRDAQNILEVLRSDSPLSTKQLKLATDMKGKFNEAAYTRALKELWSRLLIVAYGEVDDGAFPSLAIGATEILFEDLWNEAREMSASEGRDYLRQKLGEGSLFLKFMVKTMGRMNTPQPPGTTPNPL